MACCGRYRPVIYLCSTRPPHEAFCTFCAALVQVIITTYELILKDAAILNQVCAVACLFACLHPPFDLLQAGATCWIASQKQLLAGSAHCRLAWPAAQPPVAPLSAKLLQLTCVHGSLQPFAINLWHAVH